MAGLGTILSTAANALRVQQQNLEVTSHNLANAGTEGYSRQRSVVVPAMPTYTSEGAFGAGALTVDVVQVRDLLLDRAARDQFSLQAQSDTRAGNLARLENVFAEPTEQGLAATMDRFFAAWSDLATDPGSSVARTVARQRTGELADTLNGLARDLDGFRAEVETRLDAVAGRINELVTGIADLNRQIVSAEVGGNQAPDLRDLRGRSLDELSKLVSIQVHEGSDGSVNVTMSGIGVVGGSRHGTIAAADQGGTTGLTVVGVAGLLTTPGGEAQGLIENLNLDLAGARASLDEIAAALVSEANARHAAGVNVDGGTGVDLFDPTGTTANSIGLSSQVRASARAIASGTPDGAGSYRAGANDVALALAALRDAPMPALGTDLRSHFTGLVSSIGQTVRSALDRADVHGTLAEHADNARLSVSGVSTDEELVQMIRFQTAYQSAARVVTAADEMLRSMLTM